jgi:very-short-patch-repair endonuclease
MTNPPHGSPDRTPGFTFNGPSFGSGDPSASPTEGRDFEPSSPIEAPDGATEQDASETSVPPVAPSRQQRRPRFDGPHAERLARTLEHWKQQLLDLTKRNRALNFKVQKVATVTVVDEHPAEVFRRLVLDGEPMRFHPTLPSKDAKGDAVRSPNAPPVSQVSASDDEDDDGALELDFAPYDSSDLDDRHTDDVLQCAATPEALDKSLRRLDEQARSTIEEQGVNALFFALGMLHHKESADSDVVLRAPTVLVPVELTRKSARSGYLVRVTDDDPMVNPSLAEYVRRNFGVTLPELPDLSEITDYDLQDLFRQVAEAIGQQTGWRITTDSYLGLFNFQKLVMYKDLEKNAEAFGAHRLVKQLVTREGSQTFGLPEAIRAMELDREFPPEETFQVVDADSSQLRAIAAVARRHDLVLEGPPGTGKSQTITNLIAQAIASGKSVLFAAEKKAALDVVHTRLVSAGLGEFCLEVHSTKANKRAVMQELKTALDASLQRPQGVPVSGDRLKRVRAQLTDYAAAVHTSFGRLGISPFEGFGRLGAVLDAPKLPFGSSIDDITTEDLEEIDRRLADLAAHAAVVGDVRSHPWRDTRATFYGEASLDTIEDLVRAAAVEAADVARIAAHAERTFGLPPISSFADVDVAGRIADVSVRSPGAPLRVLENAAWNQAPPQATALVTLGRSVDALAKKVGAWFAEDALQQDHATDIAYVEQKSQGFFGFLAFVDGRYRSIKRRWIGYRKPAYEKALIDQANDLKSVDQLRADRRRLEDHATPGRELFGALWQGESSDWALLDRYIGWVVEFRGLCVTHGLQRQAMEVAAQAHPDVSGVRGLVAAAAKLRQTITALCNAVGWPDTYFDGQALLKIAGRVAELEGSQGLAPRWAAFEAARQQLDGTSAENMVAAAMRGEIAFGDLPRAYRRAFYQKWLDRVVHERPTLRHFQTLSHEQRVAEFRELDQRVLHENRVRLVTQQREEVQRKLLETDAAAGMPYLRREMARQRGLSPLRRTIQQAEAAIRAIKPCFLMSPLSVAQYLNGAGPTFDLVLFDEASQLPAEEAIGAIARGRQLVVVGDPKQLPPTNFFSIASTDTPVPLGEDGLPVYEDSESVLEEYMGAGVPVTRLKWHYRSAHESLITFSNVSFYDADLYTFPSVDTGTGEYGLTFEHVADGVYEGKGLNMAEARRVVDAVVDHIKTRSEESLGVGTFNMRQQIAIQDELELRRRQDPSIESFFGNGRAEPFFVKNLENIQGDERDVIFLSVTYAKGPDGRLRYHFGPINGENGWRRLNVLTTRARKRMRVFSSMRGDEISPAASASTGPRLLRDFLLYAERGRLESTLANAQAAVESPLESDVLTELTRRGYTVDPQIGVAGYRIDLGVRDPALPGRYVCGIECDGVAYHSSETARDRDRLRQQVLEGRGWTIVRLWSTDWFKDRAGQIERLAAAIENARRSALDHEATQREAKQRADEERAAKEAERKAKALSAQGTSPAGAYQRPVVPAYQIAGGQGRLAEENILDTPLSRIVLAFVSTVHIESPVHVEDLFARVAGVWSTRLSSRISKRIEEALEAAVRERSVERRGDFVWKPGRPCRVRSRTGIRIPPERIAPEEYQEAIRLVLQSAGTLSKQELIAEVRSVLGYGRASQALADACEQAIGQMLANRELGEGSTGFALRG